MKSKNLYSLLKEKIRKRQSKERFEHSVAVGNLAAALGKVHGWSPERARLAGLLHDYVKEWSPKKLKRYVKKYKLKIPDKNFILKISPNMLHAYVGADVVRRKGWIKNKKDLKAIAAHTLGAPKMGLEDKILFIADFAAPGRPYASAALIRKKAKKNLKEAFRETLALKIGWQLVKNKAIHPMPVHAWNRLIFGVYL